MANENMKHSKMAVMAMAAALLLIAGIMVGCSKTTDDADIPEASGTDAQTTEEAAPEPDETFTGTATYGGLTFELPQGWKALVTDHVLSVEFSDGVATDASVQGTIKRAAATEGDEQAAVDAYISGVQEVLSQQPGYKELDYSASVEGVPSKAVKCSLSSNDMTVEVYAVSVAVNGDITSLIMASSEGEYNAEFESIISSIAIA